MSKHSIAKEALAALAVRCEEESIDYAETLEALTTWCVRDLTSMRGPQYSRDYVRYELDSIGFGGLFEIQRR